MGAYDRSVSWRVRSCYEQVWGGGGEVQTVKETRKKYTSILIDLV